MPRNYMEKNEMKKNFKKKNRNNLTFDIRKELLEKKLDQTTELPNIDIEDWVGIMFGPNDSKIKIGKVLFKKDNGECAEEYIIQIDQIRNLKKPFREIIKIGPCEIISHVAYVPVY